MPISIPPDLPVDLQVPPDVRAVFANYTFVQTIGFDVVLSFFQAIHPMLGAGGDAATLKTLPATCVARVGLNAAVAEGFLRVLADILGFEVQKKAEKAQKAEAGDAGSR